MALKQWFVAAVVLPWSIVSAHAQFGLKCDSPSFSDSLATSTYSVDIQAAIRATCAYNKKSAEINATFGKNGWSDDLFPKARIDIAELTELANKAAELNFATNDPRALGNIRNIYTHLGDQKRWLADNEKRLARRQHAAAAPTPGDGSLADQSQASASATYVFVVFQDNISNDDKATFLKAYQASIVDGPDKDGAYRLSLNAPPPADQLQLVLDSMKSQTNILKNAFAK